MAIRTPSAGTRKERIATGFALAMTEVTFGRFFWFHWAVIIPARWGHDPTLLTDAYEGLLNFRQSPVFVHRPVIAFPVFLCYNVYCENTHPKGEMI